MLFLSDLVANEEGGIEILKNNVDDKTSDFNQPAIVNAVTKLQKILQENASANSVGAAYADAANNFMSEGSVVILNGPWMSADFAPDSSDKWSNNFDGANVHADLLPGNIGLANTRGWGEWWVSAYATDEEIELAKAWLDFVNSQEELEAYMLAEGGSCPNMEYSENFLAKQERPRFWPICLQPSTTRHNLRLPILDIMPTSVGETEVGKMLPQLIDGTPDTRTVLRTAFCQGRRRSGIKRKGLSASAESENRDGRRTHRKGWPPPFFSSNCRRAPPAVFNVGEGRHKFFSTH